MVRLFHSWPKNEPIFRIHPSLYGGAQFNPSADGNARFSPLMLPGGGIVPVLYGAATFSCAAMETIFHDLPDDTSDFIFDFTMLEGAVVSVLAPRRNLKLLPLTSIDLKSLGLKKTDVIETSVQMYEQTRKYALEWHTQFPAVDGLYWTSKRDDRAQACMLFGDRVRHEDLTVAVASAPVQTAPHLEQLVHLAKELGITQARSFPSSVTGF